MTRRPGRDALLLLLVVALAAGCSWTLQPAPAAEPAADPATAAPPPPRPPPVERRPLPRAPLAASVHGDLATATSALARMAYARSAVVVVATDTLPRSLAAAVAVARALPAPLVVGRPDDGRRLAADLGAERVVTVGATSPATSRPDPVVHPVIVSGVVATTVERLAAAAAVEPDAIVLAATPDSSPLRDWIGTVLDDRAPVALVDVTSLDGDAVAAAAAATGLATVDAAGLDLLADRDAAEALAERRAQPSVLVAATPLDRQRRATLAWTAAAAAAGNRILPQLGWRLLPDVRLVGLYGHPETSALGVLGEQGIEDAVERAREQADAYAAASRRPVVPMFEMIATVAAAEAGEDGDRSRETDLEVLAAWVDAAGAAGVYVLLDLQPGLSTFLEQARAYEPLLRRPHVGLALDPEWRLDPCPPRCVHLRSIGSVAAEEVNDVATWLAELVVDHQLPQKLFLVHQFKQSMIRDRDRIRTDLPQLAVTIQMDGQGTQPTKLATWRALLDRPDAGRFFWGWKNFHDEDTPTRTPEDTLSLEPRPVVVTYQ